MQFSRLLTTTSAAALIAVAAGAGSANAQEFRKTITTSVAVTPAAELFGLGLTNVGPFNITLADNAAQAVDVTYPAEFLLDFDLTNATWTGSALTSTSLDVSCTGTTPTRTITNIGDLATTRAQFRIEGADLCAAGTLTATLTGVTIRPATNVSIGGNDNRPAVSAVLHDLLNPRTGGLMGFANTDSTPIFSVVSGTNVVAPADSNADTVTTTTTTISSTTGSTRFVGNTTIARVGEFTLLDGATAVDRDLTSAWATGVTPSATTGIVITGDFTAAAGTGACASGVWIELDDLNGCTGGDVVGVVAADKQSVSFSLNAATTATAFGDAATGNHEVWMTVSGTTIIEPTTFAGTVTVDFDPRAPQGGGTAVESYVTEVFGPFTLDSIDRDGSERVVPFVTASTSNRSVVRIRNTGSAAGRVRIRLYGDVEARSSGEIVVPRTLTGLSPSRLNTVSGLDSEGRLPAGAAIELDVRQIEAITGVPLRGANGRLIVVGEFSDIEVQPFFFNANGIFNADFGVNELIANQAE